jgi:hypothetical protein
MILEQLNFTRYASLLAELLQENLRKQYLNFLINIDEISL